MGNICGRPGAWSAAAAGKEGWRGDSAWVDQIVLRTSSGAASCKLSRAGVSPLSRGAAALIAPFSSAEKTWRSAVLNTEPWRALAGALGMAGV